MLTIELIPEPDGRVAVYVNGKLRGYARDQAHAEDWAIRYEQALRNLAPLAWEGARILWRHMTPEQQRAFNAPDPVERAA